jgi:hypothetical protein
VRTTRTFTEAAEATKFAESQQKEYPHGRFAFEYVQKHGQHVIKGIYTFDKNEDAYAFRDKWTKDPSNPVAHQKEVDLPIDTAGQFQSKYTALPDIHIARNGAASMTTDPNVANDWDGSTGRVVLRASVPRTAVVSLPVYGQNIHSEHEVVVAGTAWKKWDSWYGKAPTFKAHPIAA